MMDPTAWGQALLFVLAGGGDVVAQAAQDAAAALDGGDLLKLLLSASGGAFLMALVSIWKDMRSGVAASRREAVDDLREWRDDLDRARKLAAADRDFWRDLCAERGAQVRELGGTPANPQAVPPSQSAPPAGRRRGGKPRDRIDEDES